MGSSARLVADVIAACRDARIVARESMIQARRLGVDSLLAIEIVTAAGDILIADDAHHADLFWAVRGGGGNFGVVTRMKFRLHPLPQFTGGPLVLVGSSMGGWLMLLVALARPERVAGLVGIAAAPDFTDWGFDDARRAILQENGVLAEPSDYDEAPRITTLGFWRSGQANLLLGGEIAFDDPVRLLHGLQDDVVPTSIALRLGRALRSADVQTILVKDGDHRLSRPQDLDLLVATTARLVESL